MQKHLKPIAATDAWSLELERLLRNFLRQLIYDPLFEIIEEDTKENAKVSALERALRSGQVSYKAEVFLGRFSAEISRELKEMGAKWDLTHKGYRIDSYAIPTNITRAIEQAAARQKRFVDALREKIESVQFNVTKYFKGLDLKRTAEKSEGKITEKFRATVTKEIGIDPHITPDTRERLQREYTENVKLSITNVSKDRADQLREIVEDYVTEGKPRGDLVKHIKASLRVSDHRAKFIARQETNLFTSKLKQIQYEAVGIDKYVWKSTGDSRTRTKHQDMNGKVCYWDKKLRKCLLAKDSTNGKDDHPREDYQCRCDAVPIVEFNDE
jgi:SPP1 gp7 family putative phage head morphogenesis protein